MTKDRIFLQGLQFFGYHGVLPEERELGQKFTVDLEIVTDLAKAGKTDDLDHTVNYVLIYDLVKEIMTGRPYKLIETAAETIADKVIKQFPVEEVKVTVKKPHPPIPGILDYVAVQVVRERN